MMGNRGGAPPWVYKQEAAIRAMSHDGERRSLRSKIEKLEEENKELRKQIAELSIKIQNLKESKR